MKMRHLLYVAGIRLQSFGCGTLVDSGSERNFIKVIISMLFYEIKSSKRNAPAAMWPVRCRHNRRAEARPRNPFASVHKTFIIKNCLN